MKLINITTGQVVRTDAGFTCMDAGEHVVKSDDGRLYIACRDGKHFLEGQEDEPGADLVGIS